MQPTKIIEPPDQNNQSSTPPLTNVRQASPRSTEQSIKVFSPDELDRADRQSTQAIDAKIAEGMIKDINQRERDKLIANSIGSRFGDLQTTSYYGVQTADKIGFPYYLLVFLSIGLGLLGFKYRWMNSAVGYVSMAASLYFIFLWIRQWRSLGEKVNNTHKLKDE